MVRGSGRRQPTGDGGQRAPPRVRSGAVRCSAWSHRPDRLPRSAHWPWSTTPATIGAWRSSRRARQPPASVGPIVTSATAGTFLIVAGLILAYIAFATPTMACSSRGRADPVEMAVGMVAWTIALIAPAACLLLGTNRLARMLAAVHGRVGRRSTAAGVLDGLPDDVVVASGSSCPTGGRCRT